MAPKKHRVVKKAVPAVAAVDPNAWVDTIDLTGEADNAVIDHDALWRAYRLLCQPCAADKHPQAACRSAQCFGGLRQVKSTNASLASLVEKIVGPQPGVLEPLPDVPSVTDNEEARVDGPADHTADPRARLLPPAHRGLRNLGNTCYLNAILQLVFHVPELRKAIVLAAQTEPSGPISSSGLPWIFMQLGFARYPTVDATPLVDALQLDKHIQQDAQELLGLLLEWLSSSACSSPPPSATSSPSAPAPSDINAEVSGLMLYTRSCPDCGADAKKVETFSFLSVQPATTLAQSLNRMCDDEPVEGFQCGKCGHSVTAVSRAQLKRLPRTLLIHLSRFGFDVKSGQRTKIDTNIGFPTTLDISQWVGAQAGGGSANTKYTLEGVVNHLGATPQRGHYTFHCRQRDDTWYSFDDADVTKLRKYAGDNTASRDAYVLVYRSSSDSSSSSVAEGAESVHNKFPELNEFPSYLVDDLLAKHAAQEADHASWQDRHDACLSAVKSWSTLVDRVVMPPKAGEDESDGPLYFIPTNWLTTFGTMFSNGVAVGSPAHPQGSTAATAAPTSLTSYAAALVNGPAPSTACEEQSPTDADVVTFELPSSYRCRHNKLRVDAPVKAVRESVYCELMSMYGQQGDSTSPLTTDNGLCVQCAVAHIREIQSKRDDAVLLSKMILLARVRDNTVGNLVNAAVVDAWLESGGADAAIVEEAIVEQRRSRPVAAPRDNEEDAEGSDSGAATPSARSALADLALDLLCPHGKLAPDVPQYIVHTDLFRYLVAEKGFLCSQPMHVTVPPSPNGAPPSLCEACVDAVRDVTSSRHANNQRKLKESKTFVTLLTDRDDFNRAVWRRNIAEYAKKHRVAWEKEQQRKDEERRAAEEEAKRQLGQIKLVVVSSSDASGKRGRGQGNAPVSPNTTTQGGGKTERIVLDVDEVARAKEGDRHAPIVVPHDGVNPSDNEAAAAICPPRVVSYMCIPTAWVETWLAWYRDANNSLPPPGPITTSSCVCPHGNIPASIRELHPKDCAEMHGLGAVPPLLILCEEEYNAVIEAYGPVRGPTILFKEVDAERVLDPPTCATCVAERVNAAKARTLQYTNGILSVEGSIKRSKKKMEVISETLGNNHCLDTIDKFAERIAMRILERHQLLVPAESLKFAKSKSALKNEEWHPKDKTFADLGIEQFSTIYFTSDDIATKVEGHFDPVGDDSISEVHQGKKATTVEVSFESTRLSNLAAGTHSSTAAAAKLRECKICTFLNPPNAKTCEICESLL